MTTLAKRPAVMRLVPSGLFSDQPEESLRLRVLVLMIFGWVAFSLVWVTGSPLAPLGAVTLAVAGHWTSWRWRRSPLGYRSFLIVASITALTIVARDDLVASLGADRLRIAEYLVLIAGIASFGVRTRGGLYGQLALSGLVLYFVGERGFGSAFPVFLIVFLGLFLTFNVMTFLMDQFKNAHVHWREGQLGRLLYWVGIVGGGLLVCSAVAFALLPADYRGHAAAQRVGIVPFMGDGRGGPDISRQAVTQSEAPGSGEEVGETAPAASMGIPVGPEAAIGSGKRAETGQIGGPTGQSGEGAVDARTTSIEGFDPTPDMSDRNDIVMRVRSGVTSYWRGQLFDRFDGQTWYRSSASPVQRAVSYPSNFYWQAFFVERDQPGALFTGYNGVLVLPREVRESGTVVEGSAYSVLSQQPILSSDSLRGQIAGEASVRYLMLPPTAGRVRELAKEITGDAYMPFRQMWLIAGYLRQHHTYDVMAENQLQLSGDIEDFLADGAAGTSLDFATAAVLLARALGIPARLAVGYLPGGYDHLTGTHRVRGQDAHAWAEVHFDRSGWVPFDGTPRPELQVFTSGNMAGFSGNSFILQAGVGGGLYRVLQSKASEATDIIAGALEGRGGLVGPVAAALTAPGLVLGAYWILKRRSRKKREEWRYSRLTGESRRKIVGTFKRLERLLQRRGLEPRQRCQTIGEYAEAAASRFVDSAADLEWLARAARAAAYDPAGPGIYVAREAAERLSRVKRGSARLRWT